MRQLVIGNKVAKKPIIQGGMGVGVSLSRLAGAVAKEGGIGVISTAQIGYDEADFEKDPAGCNLWAIAKHIKKAKEIAGGAGLVGVNVMVALRHYREHVVAAVKAGADVIISGAGLPADLPEIVSEAAAEMKISKEELPKLAPIVSSEKAAKVILKLWAKKYDRTADFLVIEGPKAGGHLGFSKEELKELEHLDYDEEIRKIIACKSVYEQQYGRAIPVIVAGGIYSREDVEHAFALGADGVQVASRFVATYECDASDAYKQAYIQAQPEDIRIVQSPVGMPGRALDNAFIRGVERERKPISKCYGCIKSCNPGTAPYCITKALIEAVKGNVDEGLIFCGANAGKIDRLMSVQQLMQELCG
jgi:NAD(P)H-dependent flavin oxidoreductase YrpB (nitropropane dioxygenase family)